MQSMYSNRLLYSRLYCCRLNYFERVNHSLELIFHLCILKKLSSICDDVILRIRRAIVVSIHNARHDTYSYIVSWLVEGRSSITRRRYMSTTWILHILIQTTLHPSRRHLSYSAYYQLDFRGDLTASCNLSSTRERYNTVVLCTVAHAY